MDKIILISEKCRGLGTVKSAVGDVGGFQVMPVYASELDDHLRETVLHPYHRIIDSVCP